MERFAEVVAPSNNSDFQKPPTWNDAVEIVENFPPADVRPVVRGRWILDSDPGEPWKYKCDLCGEVTNNTCMGKPRYNYCPMCGALMEDNDA